MNKELLKNMCSIYSPSGNETAIRDFIVNEIKDYVDEIKIDPLGNLIARKKGPGKKIMLAGHMDQIGLMVTFIDENGFLRFTNVGGLAPAITLSQRVIFENGIIGVIGSEKLESIKDLNLDKLYIDIGASSQKEAEEMVSIGDVCVYYSEPIIDDKKVVSQALDDRIGCFIMIEALKALKDSENDLYFVFTVQEEVGIRGAKTSAYTINPDFGIAIDVTTTGDTPNAKKMAVKLGNGPAIKVKDNSILCHPVVKNTMIKRAKENDIKYQLEVLELGGTDSGAIHLTRSGIPAGVISIPTRYIHSNCEMCYLSDITGAIELTVKLVESEFVE
ncbi:M42 family metallopeptidase [Alkaliphilus peptidifermentans]|uniref:Endoglucanase n=1 Tax=Alkaliphilus peptidifermentans DSM 18978 TaxID=1120976 RepID=A0A1G5KKU9_9FIRM|nr:M42 family metallopeptidase [Alkaliphilus peptidifermentans]SCZ01283.1 endoglucanase [Alkaliphilus peptidifermentans DSM 18978]